LSDPDEPSCLSALQQNLNQVGHRLRGAVAEGAELRQNSTLSITRH
jgi:hypothetical protein